MRRSPWLLGIVVAILVVHAGCNRAIVVTVPHCDGNTKVTWNGNVVDGVEQSAREDCGSRTCTEDQRSYGSYVACALGGRDPRCNPETDAYVCDGDQFVACSGAYAEVTVDCAARGQHCVVGAGGLADCTATAH